LKEIRQGSPQGIRNPRPAYVGGEKREKKGRGAFSKKKRHIARPQIRWSKGENLFLQELKVKKGIIRLPSGRRL